MCCFISSSSISAAKPLLWAENSYSVCSVTKSDNLSIIDLFYFEGKFTIAFTSSGKICLWLKAKDPTTVQQTTSNKRKYRNILIHKAIVPKIAVGPIAELLLRP